MARRPWATRLLSASGCALALGCALGDLFTPSSFEELTLTFAGTTTLQVGSRVPLCLSAQAGGQPVPQPRFRVVIQDTSRVTVTPGMDTLVGLQIGQTDLIVRFESSIFTDTVPSLVATVRVLGGPPTEAPCP